MRLARIKQCQDNNNEEESVFDEIFEKKLNEDLNEEFNIKEDSEPELLNISSGKKRGRPAKKGNIKKIELENKKENEEEDEIDLNIDLDSLLPTQNASSSPSQLLHITENQDEIEEPNLSISDKKYLENFFKKKKK